MSDMQSFRVSVNLCLWFHDHRKRAKIFINDDIKTIGDLERRIEKIFKIKNFYLTCHEEYLPPIEDVRILQRDDVVWVIQNKNEVNTTAPVKESDTEVIIATKKRPISLIEDEDYSQKKKKKKKLGNEKIKTPSLFKEKHKKKKSVNNELEMATDGETSPKKDKDINSFNISEEETYIQNKNNSVNINTLLPVLQHHIKSYNKKNSKKSNKEETLSTTSTESLTNSSISRQNDTPSESNKDNATFYKSKGTLSSYKKKISVPLITDKYLKEKKVNIVKIEYLSGGPTAINHSDLKVNEDIHCQKQNHYLYDQAPKNIDITADESNASRSHNSVNQNLVVNECLAKLPIEKEKRKKSYSKWDNKHSNTSKTITSEYEAKGCKDKIEDTSLLLVRNEEFDKEQVYRTSELSNASTENLLQLKNSESMNVTDNSKKCILHCPEDKIESKDLRKATSFIEYEFIPKKSVTPIITNEQSLIEKVEVSEPQICLTPLQIGPSSEKVESYENDLVQVQLNNAENDLESVFTKSHEQDNISSVFKRDSNPVPIENFSSVSKQDLSNPSIMMETNLNDNINYLELESTKEVTKSVDRLSNASGSSQRTSSIFSRRKHLSGLGELLEGLRSSESVATVDSMDSDHSEFITKRQRKRVRRRKKKNPEVSLDTSLNDSSFPLISDYKPKPIKTRACPIIHLKFEEEEGKPLKVVDVTKKNDPEDENESYVETSCIDNITIESDIESSKLDSFNIQEEHILKSPFIRNLLPKVGDVIAFKILRITENYTPEISSYIIGKVNKFTADSKSVSFDILNGLEQCEDPKGKLSINFNENAESRTRDFIWTEILDPRLLFP